MNLSAGLVVDIIALIIFLLFMYRGLIKGFSGEIIGLVGLFVSIFCAWKFLDPAVALVYRYLGVISIDRSVIALVCAVAIFFIVELVFALISWILSMLVKVTQLSFTDHFFGMLIGAVKALFIIIFVYGILITFSPIIPTGWMNESYTMKAASFVWPYIRDVLQSKGILDFSQLSGNIR